MPTLTATVAALLGLLSACSSHGSPRERERAAAREGTSTAEPSRVHTVMAAPAGSPGAAEISVPSGLGERYVTARLPGGAERIRLTALDEAGRVLGADDGQGQLAMPRLHALPRVARLRVEALDGRPGRVRVYVNDARDADGDGLGERLERELGTCDSVNQPGCGDGPLGEFFRRVARGTRDSDRDGLDDAEELLGVEGVPALDLPRWGADPRHKDLFIEADYRAAMGSVQLDEADLVQVSELYLAGSAHDLRNPDGQPGVHLHVDVGFTPSDPSNAALFGDWGGSNAVEHGDYHRAAREELTENRRGRFRHLLVRNTGTGQGKVLGNHFTFNRNYHRVRVFAHELGHTLGLRHHGLDAWGRANCKPNYRSLMNYVYQNEPAVGFSVDGTKELDPRMLYEEDGLGIDDPSFLREPPFELDTLGRAVDWNRNGRIDRTPVRAGAAWATYKSCGELARGQSPLAEGPLSPGAPALVTAAGRLFALWVDAGGRLWLRSSALSGPDAQGSCPLGDAIDTRCSRWSSPLALEAPEGLRHVAASALEGSSIALALASADGTLWLQQLDGLDQHAPRVSVAVEVPAPRLRGGPSLIRLRVDPSRFGAPRLLHAAFLTERGVLTEALAPAAQGPFLIRPLRDTEGRTLESVHPPGVVELDAGACGALPDLEGFIRLFCYDGAADGWVNVSESAFYGGLGPRTTTRVGVAFHRYRGADGTTLDPSEREGALYLAFTDDADHHYPDMPWLLISEAFDAGRPLAAPPRLRWRGQLVNQWTSVVPGAGVSLYEDRSLSALKALLPLRGREQPKLLFLPLADGSYGARLGSGNDFRAIETGICTGLRGRARCQ